MLSKRIQFPGHIFSMITSMAACAMLSACAATPSSSPASVTTNASSAQSAAQEVPRLQQAKALDNEALKDLTLYPNRRADVLKHEAAAAQTIRDLQYGYSVDPGRLAYALEVPPRHLSSAQKTVLIQQLKAAIQKDDAREQTVVAFSSNLFNEDPNAPSEYGYQELLAQKEIKELEEGGHVSWDELQEALYVPPNPL
jgi:hypothetical protein